MSVSGDRGSLIGGRPRSLGLLGGTGPIAEQLRRSAVSTVTTIAEGTDRAGVGEKRLEFSIARGEVGEAAAAIELGVALGLLPAAEADAARALASRVSAMLAQRVRRWGG